MGCTDYIFQAVAGYDKLLISQKILSLLQSPTWKLYFHFLEFVLPKFTELNLMFRSSKSSVHCLHKDHNGLSAVYRELLFAGSLLVPLKVVDPASQVKFLPLPRMYMGAKIAPCLMQEEYKVATTFKLAAFLEVCARILYRSCLSDKELISNWRPDYRDASSFKSTRKPCELLFA